MPTSRPRSYGVGIRRSKDNTNNRGGCRREGGVVDAQRGIRNGCAQEGKVNGKDWAVTAPLLLPEWIPVKRSDRSGATNHCINSMGRGRGVIYQAKP